MARHYHVDIAAFAAGVDIKWVDNLLSHFDVPGVESARRGVARRLSLDAIRTIALTRTLSQDTGLSVDQALVVAVSLLDSHGNQAGRAAAGAWVTLTLDRDGFERHVDRRVAEAVESLVPRRRGRPPGRRGRESDR